MTADSTTSSRSASPEPTTHKRRAWSKKYWTLVNVWWIWESFGWLLSTACLVTIVGILAHYDGKPLRNWSHSISLNSTLAVLSAVSKSALMVPVSAGISQLKWTRLRRGRRLLDLQEFDEASRGPLGSAWLIWRGGVLAFIGTLIILTGLAFEPFVQQVVSYPSRQVDRGLVSSIPRSQNYTSYIQQGITVDPPTVAPDMKAAIYVGMYTNGTQLTPLCSTTNCTWDPFETVAICSTCKDVTEDIAVYHPTPKKPAWGSTDGCIMWLPNGPNNLGLTASAAVDWLVPLFNLSTVFEEDTLLVNFTAIYYDSPEVSNCSAPYGGARATECNIYWCVNTYQSKVSNNALTETIVGSLPMTPSLSRDNFDQPDFSLEVNKTTYHVPGWAQTGLQGFLLSVFAAGNLTRSEHYAFTPSTDMVGFVSDAASNHTKGIAKFLDRLTQTMTQTARSTTNIAGGPGSNLPFHGVAWEELTFIHVRWAWLALPFALDCLAIIFLACVVIQTVRTNTEIWKSSQMVTIFRGLSLRDLMDFDTPDGVVEMDEIARRVRVRLQNSSALPEGKRLVKVD